MKASVQATKQTSNWQTERAKILQRACRSIKAAAQRGAPIGRAIRRTARRYNGRPFKCDPARRLAVSSKSLRRHWDAWRRGGELPAAFRLQFKSRPSAVTAPVMIRFADFCATGRRKSMRAAWLAFAARPGAFGHGRRKKNFRPISYDSALREFGAANFYLIQDALRKMQTSQTNLAQVRLSIIADLRRRLSDRPPRPRARRPNDFQI